MSWHIRHLKRLPEAKFWQEKYADDLRNGWGSVEAVGRGYDREMRWESSLRYMSFWVLMYVNFPARPFAWVDRIFDRCLMFCCSIRACDRHFSPSTRLRYVPSLLAVSLIVFTPHCRLSILGKAVQRDFESYIDHDAFEICPATFPFKAQRP